MTKIEITDEIVTRFLNNMMGPFFGDGARERAKATLEAALNPPPEPEIEVTKEMLSAAANAYNRYTYEHHSAVTVPLSFGAIAAAYRAMRALEPKPKGNIQDDPRWPFHQRAGDAPQYWSHRRSPDMKSTVASDGTIFTTRGASRLHNRNNDRVDDAYFHRRAGDPK